MAMHNPAHPGEVIREACLKPLDLTATAAAEALGVTRKALSDLLNGHSGVSPDMAIRLEKVGWSTAGHWLPCNFNAIFGKRTNAPPRSRLRRNFPHLVRPEPGPIPVPACPIPPPQPSTATRTGTRSAVWS